MENRVYIGIDASISSTAVCVLDKEGEKFYNYSNKEKLTQWMKDLESVVAYRQTIYDYPKGYSESEVYKVTYYNKTTDLIVEDLMNHCAGSDAIVAIEGYSYSSAAGNLIDLVTLGASLRYKLITKLNAHVTVLAPMTLKSESCKLAYDNYDAKKKVWRNDEGIAGGSFQKHEMLKALFKRNPDCGLVKLLSGSIEGLLGMKNLPKPIDDLVDAKWCVEYLRSRDEKSS